MACAEAGPASLNEEYIKTLKTVCTTNNISKVSLMFTFEKAVSDHSSKESYRKKENKLPNNSKVVTYRLICFNNRLCETNPTCGVVLDAH